MVLYPRLIGVRGPYLDSVFTLVVGDNLWTIQGIEFILVRVMIHNPTNTTYVFQLQEATLRVRSDRGQNATLTDPFKDHGFYYPEYYTSNNVLGLNRCVATARWLLFIPGPSFDVMGKVDITAKLELNATLGGHPVLWTTSQETFSYTPPPTATTFQQQSFSTPSDC